MLTIRNRDTLQVVCCKTSFLQSSSLDTATFKIEDNWLTIGTANKTLR